MSNSEFSQSSRDEQRMQEAIRSVGAGQLLDFILHAGRILENMPAVPEVAWPLSNDDTEVELGEGPYVIVTRNTVAMTGFEPVMYGRTYPLGVVAESVGRILVQEVQDNYDASTPKAA